MESLSPSVAQLLKLLQHPVRLPVLLVLGHDEMTAAEIASSVGVSFDAVNYALRDLLKSGLVEVARHETPAAGARGNTTRRVYRGVRDDWQRLLDCLNEFATAS